MRPTTSEQYRAKHARRTAARAKLETRRAKRAARKVGPPRRSAPNPDAWFRVNHWNAEVESRRPSLQILSPITLGITPREIGELFVAFCRRTTKRGRAA